MTHHDMDDAYEDFEPECDRCHGDGMDPWNDHLLPCPVCQGEQSPALPNGGSTR